MGEPGYSSHPALGGAGLPTPCRCQWNCHPVVGAGAGIPLADSPRPGCGSAKAGVVCEGVWVATATHMERVWEHGRDLGAEGTQAGCGQVPRGALSSSLCPNPSSPSSTAYPLPNMGGAALQGPEHSGAAPCLPERSLLPQPRRDAFPLENREAIDSLIHRQGDPVGTSERQEVGPAQ